MLQRVFIPIVVKIYIAMGIVLYTAQKVKLAVRKSIDGNKPAPVKLKAGY